MVKQTRPMASDALHDTHKFQGLMSADQYKRKRDDVLDEVAKTDKDAMKEVVKREAAAKVAADQQRAAREAAKGRKLAEALKQSEPSQPGSAEGGGGGGGNPEKKGKKASKKDKLRAMAATGGLSFDVADE
jgi:hypothetical protein